MTMKKILLASAAALPLLAGAAFAQSSQTTGTVGTTATPPAVTTPAPSVTTPSKDTKATVGSHADVKSAPAGQTGAAADTKAGLGDKSVGSHADAKAGATTLGKSADSHQKVEKKHEQKSEIAKKHERSTSMNDKASSPTTTQTAKKPAESSTEAPGKKL